MRSGRHNGQCWPDEGRRAISGPLTPVTSGLSRSLADSRSSSSGRLNGPDGTDSQADSSDCKDRAGGRGMRVERWVASPEPAVGVFTPAGTCPGRLRRHCGSAAPTLDRTRLPSGPAAVGFGGGAWAELWRGRCPDASPAAVMRTRTWHPASGTARAMRRASRPRREADAWRAGHVPRESQGWAG
jgi:hypothetical protein